MKKTPLQVLAEKTKRANELRMEAQAKGIRSPYRQSVYIKKNLKAI